MQRYVVSDLGPQTTPEDQQKLLAALEEVQGIKDVAVVADKGEIQFGIVGAEPKPRLLKEACTSAGFALGTRM